MGGVCVCGRGSGERETVCVHLLTISKDGLGR